MSCALLVRRVCLLEVCFFDVSVACDVDTESAEEAGSLPVSEKWLCSAVHHWLMASDPSPSSVLQCELALMSVQTDQR